jgi:hypothetical protein
MSIDPCCRNRENWIHIRSPQCFETAEHFERDVQEDDYHFYFYLDIHYCRECGRVLRPPRVELFETDYVEDIISTAEERMDEIEVHLDWVDTHVQSMPTPDDHSELVYALHNEINYLSGKIRDEFTEIGVLDT